MRRKFNVVAFAMLVFIFLAQGCSSAQLAKDEQVALAAFQKADALLVNGVAGTALQAGAQELLQADPSSPVVQRAAALMQKASTPQAQADAHFALQGGIALLKAGTAGQ